MAALVILLVILGIIFYLAPGIIAFKRKTKNAGMIILCNILLGWSGVLWIACLVFAFIDEPA